jgi:restriction endonuclease Mrr
MLSLLAQRLHEWQYAKGLSANCWKREIGVTVVRELNGVIAAQRAYGGFVVTGGQFTQEAREFANSCAIKLIDGPALDKLMGGLPATRHGINA